MIRHWLSCPVEGYLGSSYGETLASLLQTPLNDGTADGVIQKMREDIPILGTMSSSAINIYRVNTQPDRMELLIEVGNEVIEVSI